MKCQLNVLKFQALTIKVYYIHQGWSRSANIPGNFRDTSDAKNLLKRNMLPWT